jgi:phenylacetate-CoA ligase
MNKWLAKHIVYRGIQSLRGERVFEYLSQISATQHKSADEIRRIQLDKLNRIIKSAYRTIPYYRELFGSYGVAVDNLNLPGDLSRIPILTKEILKKSSSRFVNNNNHKPVSHEITSGSAGEPLVIPIDREKGAFIRAVMFRNYEWHAIDIGDKQARFWGIPQAHKLRLREALKDFSANRIRLSAFHINDDSFERFVRKLRAFKPRYFYGYPSLLYKFSQWLSENKIKMDDLDLSAIICTGEVLYDFQRKAIESTFNCKVANEYGTTETGVIAFECPAGNLHINSDHVYLESVKTSDDAIAGSLVVTELNNMYNPLIRYKIGDLGTICQESCTCGIGFPILKNLVGRESSFIVTAQNEYVFSAILSYTFKEGIKQFQGIQDEKGALLVKIVRNGTLTTQMLLQYKKTLSDALGDDMKITFDFVPHIEVEKSGKLRYFISNLQG